MKPYKMKQCISLMLVIAMVLALVPTNVFSVEAQSGWTADTGSYALTQNEKAAEVSYRVTLHFANNLGWSQVNLFTWNDHCAPTGEWPGSGISRGSDGFYTATLEYDAPANQELNFIFNNGNVQTVDLTIAADTFTLNAEGVYTAEKWVVLTTANNEGKYTADIRDNGSGIAVGPVVDGQSVIFRYSAPSAKAVYVTGSFNGWNTTSHKMVKDSNGVWTLTLQNLTSGVYEYKFMVDGAWHMDPCNNQVQNGNSAFTICNPDAEDTNTINVICFIKVILTISTKSFVIEGIEIFFS